MYKKLILIALVLTLGLMSNVYATLPDPLKPVVIWDNGANDGLWTVGQNWTTDVKPTSLDQAIIDYSPDHNSIDHSCDVQITAGQSAVCYTLFGPGYQSPAEVGNSSLTITGGTMDVGYRWWPGDMPGPNTVSTLSLIGTSYIKVDNFTRSGYGVSSGGRTQDALARWYNSRKVIINIADNAYVNWGNELRTRNAHFICNISGNAKVETKGGYFRLADNGTGEFNISGNPTINCGELRAGDNGYSFMNFRMSGGTVNIGVGNESGIKIGDDGGGLVEVSGGKLNSGAGFAMTCGMRPNGPASQSLIMKGGEARFRTGLYVNNGGGLPTNRGQIIMQGGLLQVKGENNAFFDFPLGKGSDGDLINPHAELYLSGGTLNAGGCRWRCVEPNLIVIDVNDVHGGGMFSVGGDANAFIDMSYAQGIGKLTHNVSDANNAFRFAYMPVNGNSAGVTYLGIAPKNKAWGPIPFDGQTTVTATLDLKWNPGDTITGQKLYAGTDKEALSLVDDALGAGVATYTLAVNSAVVNYWRIDSVTTGGDVTGDVWEFGARLGLATNPNPADNSTSSDSSVILKWLQTPLTSLQNQDVYFGTAFNALVKQDNVGKDVNSYNIGSLDLSKQYFWRIDSILDTNKVIGNVWSFTTLDYLTFEGFETYTDYTTLHNTWTDGDTDFTSGAYINLNVAGDPVRSGSKSAVMTLWTDGMSKAIVSRPVPAGLKDWASLNVEALTLYFYGNPVNAYPVGYANPGEVSKLYVAIDNDADPSNSTKQYYDGDDTDMFVPEWHEWNTALSGFTGVALNNVVSIGIGADILPIAYGPGIVIDDIRLYPVRCIPSISGLTADVTSDCIVDSDDLSLMSDGWLKAGAIADIYPDTPDNIVDLRDYAVLGSEWLAEGLFP